MRTMILLVLLIGAAFACVVPAASCQTARLSGTVVERSTKEVVPGASLAILGTTRGAKANRDGHYSLVLETGKPCRIRVTAIGYRPDTLSVNLSADAEQNVTLSTAPVSGAIITVAADASRREAHRIIQKVIDTKDSWQSAINDYRFGVYTRLNVRTGHDTAKNVLAVLESSAEGYWNREKGYAERIIARKQTANFPADANRAALFDVENFYNERLDFDEYSVTGPVAHDAFDRYDYDLIGEGELNGASVYKISVEPRGELVPAFRGTLWIDKADYTIAYLELTPNDAVKLGPVKDITISQTFGPVEGKYWMPTQLTFGFTIRLDLPVIPQFRFEQSAVLQNYIVNGGINDSVFVKRHIVEPRADSADSVQWAAMRAIPLAADEVTAYGKFDSIAKLPVQPHKTSFGDILTGLITPELYSYNRVEGSQFQLGSSFKVSDTWPLTLGGFVAYGLGDKRWKYSASMTQGLTWTTREAMNADMSLDGDITFSAPGKKISVSSSVTARVFDQDVRSGEAYASIVNTLTALLLHNDYPDYYHVRGFDVSYSAPSFGAWNASLHFTNQDERSLLNVTDKSILATNDHFRTNSLIEDGRLHELGGTLERSFAIARWTANLKADAEYAGSKIGSEFNFTTAYAELTLEGKAGIFGRSWIKGTIGERLSGALPPQHYFVAEARNVVIAPRDVFRTASPLEFQGDELWTAMFEQNLYDLPTRMLGVKMPIELHWFGFANVVGGGPGPPTTGAFAEAGAGLGNIFQIIRVDVSWRLTHKTTRNPFVTGTLAISF